MSWNQQVEPMSSQSHSVLARGREISMVRIKAVCARTGLSKSQVQRLVKADDFPRPIALSKRAVAWVSHEVDEWLRQRIQTSRTPV